MIPRRNRKTLGKKQAQSKPKPKPVQQPIVDTELPVDKHNLPQAVVSPKPQYTPDYIEPWESWNPRRWGLLDYSDYPTQEETNNPALKKLGVNQDYVYKKQIVKTKPEEKEEYPGTSTTYDEAFNKYFSFIVDNESTVRDSVTHLHIPYQSKEKPKKGQKQTYTIGYGHLLKPGEENDPKYKNGLTDEQVEELFKSDFQEHHNHLKKSIGDQYVNSLPFDQQMMLIDYDYNLGTVNKFPKFLNAVKAYNAATTDEERNKQRQLIANNYRRVFTDTKTGKTGPVYKRNSSLLDKYLIPSFKLKKAMVDPNDYIHKGIPQPNWIYGAVQPIDDNRGQWEHPGEVTRIASNDITMKGVPYPVLGVGADGEQRMMYPNEEHTFNQGPVTEYPMMQAQNGGWLSQYNRGGTTWLNEYAQGGRTFSAGGEKHRVYEKESPTGNGKGVQGHIMVTHPTMDKGKWDTIDLTKIAGAKTVAQGVAATKKWHAENPEYQTGGPFLPGMNPLMPSVLMSPRQLKNTTEVVLDATSFVPELAAPAYLASLPFTLYDVGEDVYMHKPWYKTTADAAGLIPYIKYIKSFPASGLKKAAKVVKELKGVNNAVNVFNTINDITDTYNDSNLPPGAMLPQVTITPKKKDGGWLNSYK